jgi:selenocysteine-specific elongation factor
LVIEIDTLLLTANKHVHFNGFFVLLAKRLSEIASTASFDKNPQSQARGMTLDLGFSAFFSTLPDHWKSNFFLIIVIIKKFKFKLLLLLLLIHIFFCYIDRETFEKIQFTLVDCPGHASLIKTIMGGAQIINTMILVIDATKGVQTQTAECLVIGEITAKHLVVVLNKIDLLRQPTASSLTKVTCVYNMM